MSLSKWQWPLVNAMTFGAGGDQSKVFRNEEVKAPGFFAADSIPADAALLAREAIQNAWDAARERRESQVPADRLPFEIRFRFLDVEGASADALIDRLGLEELAARSASVDDLRQVGLAERDCFTDLADGEDLRLLEVYESAGGGMGGCWGTPQSKLWLAMCSSGYTPAVDGRGGSFGYGKAGLIRASATRTVIAYSCFDGLAEDGDVTRRLLGMTYWGPHELGGQHYQGWAHFGAGDSADEIVPAIDDEADALAASLGLELRAPDQPDQIGTTMLLVCPTVDPHDLKRAVERFWWPALEEGGDLQFEVSIIDETAGPQRGRDGGLAPRPKSSPNLRPFIDAYQVATTPQDARREQVRKHRIGPHAQYDKVGDLGLVAQLPGWSQPHSGEPDDAEDDEVPHRSLVALVRSPCMVVEYFVAREKSPHIRGVFVADEAVNEALRQTEPKLHDAWEINSDSADVQPEHTAVAKFVRDRIKTHVAGFSRVITPPPPPPEQLRLPEWDRLMRSLWRGSGGGRPPPPPPGPRPFTILPGEQLAQALDGRLELSGSARIGFSEHHDPATDPRDEIEVVIRCGFVAEDRRSDWLDIEIGAPEGFSAKPDKPHVFAGRLVAGQDVAFEYICEPYEPDWTVELIVDANFATVSGDTDPSSGGNDV
ncbi:hypothetical protein [Candidatus Poriferisodalis sp.]|uniref:hypothetical protein n=1 Tax=Candidatus Poriferisodalis sp. TaxID=3101277 RepID=UPI003B023B22